MSNGVLESSTNVLVTGVTGLIGGELVRALDRRGSGKVWALIRPRPEMDAYSRFIERMCRSGDALEIAYASNVEVLPGNVTHPGWSLSAVDHARITRDVDIIIHCAADTSFLCSKTVCDTNIAGTRNLIELARQCERRPLIVYMSTATNSGKASHCCLKEEDGCKPDNDHHNEYTRSKAVAEMLLRESGLPVLTIRPTIVMSGDLPDQEFAQSILWFVPLLRKFHCLPLDPASRLDIIPISFVVQATLALLQKPQRAYDCYHLSTGEQYCVTIGQLNEYVTRYYRRKLPLRLMPLSQWTKEDYRTYVRTPPQRKIFFGLRYYLPFLNMNVVYDNARLTEEIGPEQARVAPLSEYMGAVLRQISRKAALQEAARP